MNNQDQAASTLTDRQRDTQGCSSPSTGSAHSPIRCPKCRSLEVVLVEVWDGSTITWRPEDGHADGILNPGSPTSVRADCEKCGHEWKLRGVLQMDAEIHARMRENHRLLSLPNTETSGAIAPLRRKVRHWESTTFNSK